ncbi:hypothetical protein ACE6ED_14020 [Paenibacillus sp. CN-4]|uniref:hypothetical protein n=1 Tax=Paenibacillus nanchangensis TaxID=3348343 RepID=UPI00397C754B
MPGIRRWRADLPEAVPDAGDPDLPEAATDASRSGRDGPTRETGGRWGGPKPKPVVREARRCTPAFFA